jgi:hypothetical protein
MANEAAKSSKRGSEMAKSYGSRPTEDKALSNVAGRLRQRAEAAERIGTSHSGQRSAAWVEAWVEAEKWVKTHGS